LEIVKQLCKTYEGKFYQNGIEKSKDYLELNQVNDYKGIFKFKGEVIIIKQVVHYNPICIFILIKSTLSFGYQIRMRSFFNSMKNFIGKGNLGFGKYEFIGNPAHFTKLTKNQRIIEILESYNVFVELLNYKIPCIVLKPFHAIGSQKKCEEYFELLVLLKRELET